MLDLYLEAFQVGRLLPTLQQAEFIVLLKRDKDPQRTDFHRPIALITTDTKILATFLSKRIEKFLPRMVHKY